MTTSVKSWTRERERNEMRCKRNSVVKSSQVKKEKMRLDFNISREISLLLLLFL